MGLDSINEFKHYCCPFGSSNIYEAIRVAREVNITVSKFYDLCEEWAKKTEAPFKDLDICYIIYDHILQMARNEINKILKFDIRNDVQGGFHTCENYSYTSYNYKDTDLDLLKEKLKEATEEEIIKLTNNDFVVFLFDNIEIDIKELRKEVQ